MKLSRRTVLRGMGTASLVTLGLPALEAMLNDQGTALAAGGALPKLFGVWYLGGGITAGDRALAVEQFFPKTVGTDWKVPPLLEPLAASRDYVTVVGGMTWSALGNESAHHVPRTATLSGSYNPENRGKGIANPGGDALGPSIDRVIADAWVGRCPINSVEMAVSQVGKYEGMISFKPAEIVRSEFNPASTFKALFGNGLPPGGTAGSMPKDVTSEADLKRKVALRKSVLDVVLQDATELKSRLGAADAARLDAHMAGIREVEQGLDLLLMNGSLPTSASCALPMAPADLPYSKDHENFAGVHQAFVDILVMALACDITRVFSLEFLGTQCNTNIWPSGISQPFHDYAHTATDDTHMLKFTQFSLTQLGYLVDRLRATAMGAGNLLDQLGMYFVSEYLDSNSHDLKNGNHPILLIGKAGGALKAGQSVRPSSPGNGTSVLLSLLHAMDIPAKSFGVGPGMATEAYADVLA
ncbi:MAG TPA: DUF1552 domain-containing protein [Polyangiaceae bacterium]|nr:DUF1552 domain-containing protein [Polyangiaceae bacterium]